MAAVDRRVLAPSDLVVGQCEVPEVPHRLWPMGLVDVPPPLAYDKAAASAVT